MASNTIRLTNLPFDSPTDASSISFGFNATHSTHDVVSQLSKVTALQRFGPDVSNHFLGRTPMEADLLHVHPISDEKISDVNVPRALAT